MKPLEEDLNVGIVVVKRELISKLIYRPLDMGVNSLNLLEVLLLEQGNLLLEIGGSLNEVLIHFFEEFDIRFSLEVCCWKSNFP